MNDQNENFLFVSRILKEIHIILYVIDDIPDSGVNTFGI